MNQKDAEGGRINGDKSREDSSCTASGIVNDAGNEEGHSKNSSFPYGDSTQEECITKQVKNKEETVLRGSDEEDAIASVGNEVDAIAPVGNEEDAIAPVGNEEDAIAPVGNEENAIARGGNEEDTIALGGGKKDAAARASDEEDEGNNDNSLIDVNTMWSDLYISRPFLKVLFELKLNNPTFIQKDVIPLALEGKSILANSETGSGKTLAFVLPILERLLHSPNIIMRRNNQKSICITKGLILLPTRELALQCYEVIKSLTKYVLITHSLFCGGIDSKEQEYEYKKKKDIFVCTPGRILDLLLNSANDFINFLEIVVFDEADKLLELGFKEECLKVLDVCKFKKQILFFSATLTKDIKDLANFSLRNPIFIQSESKVNKGENNSNISKGLRTFKISEKLSQEFVNISKERFRKATLLYLCSNVYKNHCIIFFKTRREAHLIFILFELFNFKCAELHGSLTQKKRIESILKFKKEEVDFLLCTEIASRGIDIDHIRYVINYSLPANTIKYVHRIGRTARIGKEGTACTLYLPKEKINVKKIVRGIKQRKKLNILKRTISNEHIAHWEVEIKKKKKKLQEIIEQEIIDKDIEKSTKSVDKIKNIITYKEEIMNRPPKKWFMTKKEKINLRRMNMKEKLLESHQSLGKEEKSSSQSKNAWDASAGHTQKGKKSTRENRNAGKGKVKGADNEEEAKEERQKLRSYHTIIRDLKLNVLTNKTKKSLGDNAGKEKWVKKGVNKNNNRTRFNNNGGFCKQSKRGKKK
ncbi:ATP-dependent RNA helicase DRS1, putative [Plasmodium ovale]|uniref:ATP-dependent RNA helicase DRS1, putative n=1 Tax=Plasmodium ovale TaxID=36330 RepID=A0A1C3L654_PLAOA|nr:ATP-dependent RNA helicase DRS1, putative [Plasmodium ovale]